MDFFNSAVDVLQTLVIALGAGLGIWGVINLLEGYGMIIRGLTRKGNKEADHKHRRGQQPRRYSEQPKGR